MKRFYWIKMVALAAALAGLAAGYSRSNNAQAHDHAGHDHDHAGDHDHDHDDHDHDHDDHDHDDHDHDDHGHAPAPAQKPAAEQAGHDHDEAEGHDHTHHGAASSAGGRAAPVSAFEVPESAQRLLGITFVTAEKRHVAGAVRFPGRFEWMPGARRVYGAAVPGAVELHVRPPQRVNAGDVLFTVRSLEWIAKKGEAHAADAAWVLAKAETAALQKRLAQLREAGARNAELEQQLAAKEAETVRAERARQNAGEALRAVLAMCREKDGLLVFEARDAGVVERVSVENGAWAETGAEVLCVTRADGLWFRADGVSSEMTRVRAGQDGFVEPLGKAKGDAARGKIELGLAADDVARIQPLYLPMQALPAWALPGRAGVLSVVVEESAPESVALPQACVVLDGLKNVVFVRDGKDDDRFLKYEVALGAGDGEWVEVKGLEAGAAVVLEGAYELKLASPASGGQKKAAGHFHADGQFHEGGH